jgi:hypothetical protein
VLGEFDGPIHDFKADPFSVGAFNRQIANNAHRQVYAANDTFAFFDYQDFFGIDDLLKRIEKSKRETLSAGDSTK